MSRAVLDISQAQHSYGIFVMFSGCPVRDEEEVQSLGIVTAQSGETAS